MRKGAVLRRYVSVLLALAVTGVFLVASPLPASAGGTTRTWDGGGANDHVSNALNWVGDNAPVNGDSLLFPSGAARLTVDNDTVGFLFASVGFTGSGYSLIGNPVAIDLSLSVPVSVTVAAASPILMQSGTAIVGGTLHASLRLYDATLIGSGTVDAVDTTATDSNHAVVSAGTIGTPGRLTAHDFSVLNNDTLHVDIAGTTAGTSFDQVVITGDALLWESTLSGLEPSLLDLDLVGGYTPTPGTTFTIIDNTGSGYTSGWFRNLNENDAFFVDGTFFRINYGIGPGNDVVLTALSSVSVSIADASFAEPTSGHSTMTFTVSLNAQAPMRMSFNVVASNVNAANGLDYAPMGSTIVFNTGETTSTFDVLVWSDGIAEDSETFTLTMSPADGGSVADGIAVGTIVDDPDDATSGTLQKVIPAGGSVATGDNATAFDPFQVKVSSPNAGAVEISESFGGAQILNHTMLWAGASTSAPGTIAGLPMRTAFRLHSSFFDRSLNSAAGQLVMFSGDEPLTNCNGSSVVTDGPCVTGRSVSGDDVVITVLSTNGGNWRFGFYVAPPPVTVPPTTTPLTGDEGYWMVAADGGIFSYGNAKFYGSTGSMKLNKPVVNMARTPSSNGYWMVASDGGVFAYGDAGFYGSTGSMKLNAPIIDMARTASGKGYWLVASDGGIFAFGDAGFYGSTGAMALNKPIVDMTPTADGGGYWLVASDGGVFAFGNAQFSGSTGSMRLNQPIVTMGAKPGGGYWLVAADGGVFSFGGAGFYGAVHAPDITAPIVSMRPTASGNGYWLVGRDGGIFSFGNAVFRGSARTLKLNSAIVGIS